MTNLTNVGDPSCFLLQRRRHQVNGHGRTHLGVYDNLKVKSSKILSRGVCGSGPTGGRCVGSAGHSKRYSLPGGSFTRMTRSRT